MLHIAPDKRDITPWFPICGLRCQATFVSWVLISLLCTMCALVHLGNRGRGHRAQRKGCAMSRQA